VLYPQNNTATLQYPDRRAPNVGPGTFLPRKLVEQCLGLLQNGRIKALSEPAVDWCEEIASGIAFALLAPEPGETDRGAQFPELRALLLRDADGLGKAPFGAGEFMTGAWSGISIGAASLRQARRWSD